MRKYIVVLSVLMVSVSALAQTDRHQVRAGNRDFRKDKFKEAEIDYRKALVLDSTSVAGRYNLSSTLYRMGDYEGAGAAISKIAGDSKDARVFFNEGDIALQKKDYASAVKAFRSALLQDPDDRDAKENYTYAKMMLKNNQNGGGGQNNQNQDQNQDQNKNQNKNQNNKDQQQNQDKNQNNQDQNNGEQQPQPQGQMSQEQAEQMLRAVRAKEEETQEKVNKEKALMVKSRQKEKYW